MATVDGLVTNREMPVVEIEVDVNCAPEEGDRVTLIWGSGDRATLDMLNADVAELENENAKLRQELAALKAAARLLLSVIGRDEWATENALADLESLVEEGGDGDS